MARREKVEGLVLARRSVGEADRLVTLFTRELGLMRVLAKGVRKIPSRRGGHLEPLMQVLAIVNAGHDWHYLAHVETVEAHTALRSDGQALEHARRLGFLLMQVLQEGEAHTTLYSRLVRAADLLPKLAFRKRVLLEVALTMAILQEGGLAPQLAACQKCGERKPEEAVILKGSEGGWHCLLCHAGLAGAATSLSPQMLNVLRFVGARYREALRLRLNDEEAQQLLVATRDYVALAVNQPNLAYAR